jgi:hypothetical protein
MNIIHRIPYVNSAKSPKNGWTFCFFRGMMYVVEDGPCVDSPCGAAVISSAGLAPQSGDHPQ